MKIDENKAIINNFTPSPELDKALQKLAEGENPLVALNLDMINAIHEDVITKYGGEMGIRDHNLLESVCIAPYQECFGIVLYPTIFDKAAKYLTDFARYQIFVDGNKRTGLQTAEVFLEVNGYTLDLTAEAFYNLVMHIANNRVEHEEVSKYIKENAVFLEREDYEYDR